MSGPASSASAALEQRGIDLVPTGERYGKPRDLFFLWAGTTTNIFTLSYGAMLVVLFHMSFLQAFAAIVVGNLLAYPLLALTSVQGPVTGTTTITISRSSFGYFGARFNGVASWLMLLGFEAGGLILVYYATEALLGKAGITLGGTGQVITVVVLAVIQLLLPLFGHKLMMDAQKYFTAIFTVAFVVLGVMIIPETNVAGSQAEFSTATFISAVGLMMASGGLSWSPSGANFSRYLPADTKPGQVGFWAAMGGFVPYIVLQTLGAAMATVTVGDGVNLSDPMATLTVLPQWFAVPFLLLVMVGLLAQNATNLYSSGLNLQTAGISAKRTVIIFVDSVLCALITYLAVVTEGFYSLLSIFLASLAIWLAPWVAIYLLDWVLRRGRYDLDSLANSGGGLYWGRGGIRWSGITAQILGMVAAAMFANTGSWVGPLAKLLNPETPEYAPDLAIPAGIVVAGVTYLLMAASEIRRTQEKA